MVRNFVQGKEIPAVVEVFFPRNVQGNIVLAGADNKMLGLVFLPRDRNGVLIHKRSFAPDKVKAEAVKKPLHGGLHSCDNLLFVLHEALPVKFGRGSKAHVLVAVQGLLKLKG